MQQKGLKEFSVIYTDRALNMMSAEFVKVMQDISHILKGVYNAKHTAIIPGAGTFAMESVARQFAHMKKVMVIRNGYFSFRWTDIFQKCNLLEGEDLVIKAQPVDNSPMPHYVPASIDKVLDAIRTYKPDAVFAPHVETSVGMILPDDYMRQVGSAVHEVGGVFVLDCIASGTVWVDMEDLGIDALISAPQKGWSGPCCVGIVCLSERGYQRVQESKSNSMVTNLKMWCKVMTEYEAGRFKYYTTLPTNALRDFRDVMLETKAFGFAKAKEELWKLGNAVRQRFANLGFKSVPLKGYQSPGVVVVYIPEKIKGTNMFKEFMKEGIQVAGGVPWKIGEPEGRGPKQTFRIGLFGLDKIVDVGTTIESLFTGVNGIMSRM